MTPALALALRLAFAIAAGLILGALLGLSAPVEAAGNAPGAHLWPAETRHAVSIPMGEIPPCTETLDCCGWVPCGAGPYHPALGHEPAPVPLPASGWLFLTMLCAAVSAAIWVKQRMKK